MQDHDHIANLPGGAKALSEAAGTYSMRNSTRPFIAGRLVFNSVVSVGDSPNFSLELIKMQQGKRLTINVSMIH